MAFRSPYSGLGQGLPPSRFAQPQPASARQASHANPVSPNVQPARYSSLPTPGGQEDDFPALGGGTGGVASATAHNLLSSYATQAGTLQSSNPLVNGSLPGPAPLSTGPLSPADFPALGGGFGGSGMTSELNGGLATGSGLSNGVSLSYLSTGGVAPPRAVSGTAATLQHQQQHRVNLLGAMNGSIAAATGATTRSSSNQLGLEGDARNFGLKQAGLPVEPWAGDSETSPSTAAQHSLPLLPSSNEQHSSSLQQSLPPGPLFPSSSLPRPVGVAPPSIHHSTVSSSDMTTATTPAMSNATNASAPASGQVPQTPAQQVLFSPADRFGLLGLLQIIKTSDPDLNMLTLGSDLTTMGLDLGATDNLYSTFITPWSDSKAASALNIEPEFHLPSCYNVQPPPAQSKIGNFSDETLFFIFYSQPRDAMQEMAAHELYKHNWRYHKELRLWLTKEAGTEPTQKTSSYERGSYIIFDPTVWERVRKEFVLEFSALESRRA